MTAITAQKAPLPRNQSNEIFASFIEKSRRVAHNELLLAWSKNADKFDYRMCNTFFNNMKLRLSPTSQRLSLGLDLLKETASSTEFDSLIEAFEHNIEDETGEGDPARSHATLFKESFSFYIEKIYNKKISHEPPLASTIRFHEHSLTLFNENVHCMLGAAVAQEPHALPQLELMYEGLKKQETYFSPQEWVTISDFYDIHLDGTEARHAEDLNRSIWETLDCQEKRDQFHQGYETFISLQEHFWAGLRQAVL